MNMKGNCAFFDQLKHYMKGPKLTIKCAKCQMRVNNNNYLYYFQKKLMLNRISFC